MNSERISIVPRLVIVLLFAALLGLLLFLLYHTQREARLNLALVRAVKAQDAPRVSALLAQGAKPNLRDNTGYRPAPWYFGFLHMLHLRKQPVPPPYRGPTLLMIAAYNADVPIVKALLGHGAQVNEGGVDIDSSGGYSHPLYEAVAGYGQISPGTQEVRRRIAVMSLLLHHGADVNAACYYESDHARDSALMEAAYFDAPDEAEFLLEHGADPNGYYDEVPPLIKAAQYADPRLVSILLTHGAQADGRDNGSHQTALFYIGDFSGLPYNSAEIQKREKAVFDLLLAHGANINARNGFGQTALQYGMLDESVAQVQRYLKAGANPNIKDSSGDTALDDAFAGDLALIRLLKKAGAKRGTELR